MIKGYDQRSNHIWDPRLDHCQSNRIAEGGSPTPSPIRVAIWAYYVIGVYQTVYQYVQRTYTRGGVYTRTHDDVSHNARMCVGSARDAERGVRRVPGVALRSVRHGTRVDTAT